jgi:2,4-dienoyl-CoA reductase (NADPH2)
VNPSAGREVELLRAEATVAKRVVVVGGGPGGMMAAKVAATRGHEVTLYEKTADLGGIAAIGDIAPGKKEYRWLYEDLQRQVRAHPRITVRLGCKADLRKLREDRPDAVIIATGGRPTIPDIPGLRNSPIPLIHAHDVLAGETSRVGNDVVIIGGGPTACETALYLRERGSLDAETVKFLLIHQLMDPEELRRRAMIGHPNCNVNIVQRSGKLAKDLNKSVRWALLHALNEAGVTAHVNASIMSIGENSVTVHAADGAMRNIPCDTLVIAAGITPDRELYDEVTHEFQNVPAHLVGDAVEPRQATEALFEAYVAAIAI